MNDAIFTLGVVALSSTVLGIIFAHIFTKDYLKRFDTDMLLQLKTNGFLRNQRHFYKEQFLKLKRENAVLEQLRDFHKTRSDFSHDYFVEACHGLMSGSEENRMLCEILCMAKMDDDNTLLDKGKTDSERSGNRIPDYPTTTTKMGAYTH